MLLSILSICLLAPAQHWVLGKDVASATFLDNRILAIGYGDHIALYDTKTHREKTVAKSAEPVTFIQGTPTHLTWATDHTLTVSGGQMTLPWSHEADQTFGFQNIDGRLFIWGEWQAFDLVRGLEGRLLLPVSLKNTGDGTILAMNKGGFGLSGGTNPRSLFLKWAPRTLTGFPTQHPKSAVLSGAYLSNDGWILGTGNGGVHVFYGGPSHVGRWLQIRGTLVSAISSSANDWSVAAFWARHNSNTPQSASALVLFSPTGRPHFLNHARRFLKVAIDPNGDKVAAVDEFRRLDLWETPLKP